MVDPLFNRRKGSLNVRKIHHPAQRRIHRPLNIDLNLKAVPMHPPTLVPIWNIRQPMRRLDRKLLEDLHHAPTQSQRSCESANSIATADDPCSSEPQAPC